MVPIRPLPGLLTALLLLLPVSMAAQLRILDTGVKIGGLNETISPAYNLSINEFEFLHLNGTVSSRGLHLHLYNAAHPLIWGTGDETAIKSNFKIESNEPFIWTPVE